MCFNKKILITLGIIAVAVLVLQPGWIVAAAPLLILAACPLSMVFMMKSMNADQAKTPVEGSAAEPGGLQAAPNIGKATIIDRFDAVWNQPKTDPSGDFAAGSAEPTSHGSGTWRNERS
ncbi:DUF2933 domain-containing protein [Nocardia salmonicida]|uniref:DUF2933 domain-containing protein n=1 Tax=Nocardia salmonicida TaxID=53431 RepID=UPI000B02DC3D|nr:DUF2933 domain-containing protein [Nocardia salmonicida]